MFSAESYSCIECGSDADCAYFVAARRRDFPGERPSFLFAYWLCAECKMYKHDTAGVNALKEFAKMWEVGDESNLLTPPPAGV